MPRFVAKNFEQIFAQMLAQVVAQSELSDVSDTSVVKHILAAAARADDELYYQVTLLLKLFSIHTASGDDLDARAADIQPALLTRYQALASTGQVVFSRNGTSGTVAIPVGTKVKTSDGQVFSTTVSAEITAVSAEQISGHGVGRDSAPTAVLADAPGSSGNVTSGSIVKFDARPAGVDEVTNLVNCANGQDKETDDSFRARLTAYVAGLARGTVQSLESALLGAQDPDTGAQILFAKAVEDPAVLGQVAVYIDDGTGGVEDQDVVAGEVVIASALGGEERLALDNRALVSKALLAVTSSTRGLLTEGVTADYLVNLATGELTFVIPLVVGEQITATYTYYVGLLNLAQKIIDGDPTDRENYPGYRAAGVFVQALAPQVLVQNVTVQVVPAEGYTLGDLDTAVKTAIKDYINGLEISGDVLVAELYKRIQSVVGVANTTVLVPTTDVVILDYQLARTLDSALEVN